MRTRRTAGKRRKQKRRPINLHAAAPNSKVPVRPAATATPQGNPPEQALALASPPPPPPSPPLGFNNAAHSTRQGSGMVSEFPNSNGFAREEGPILLMKDWKIISRVRCIYAPIKLRALNIVDINKYAKFDLSGLQYFLLHPAYDDDYQKLQWRTFTDHLMKYNRVARVCDESNGYVFYILPPDQGTKFTDAIVFYEKSTENRCKLDVAIMERSTTAMTRALPSKPVVATPCSVTSEATSEVLNQFSVKPDCIQHSANQSPGHISVQTVVNDYVAESIKDVSCEPNDCAKNYIRADPSYLKTLGQTHSGWIFGAVAELVDNSRDAKATTLYISIKPFVKDGKETPMLSVIDDGHGMTHQDILKMLSLGRKVPDRDDPSYIGRFGVGFKTGSMRIGRDVIVLTQTTTSRSIGFLSQSLNEGKDMLEIPIVSYRLNGSMMELDTSVQSRATAEYNLKLIKEFSRFNEYFIGELFANKRTGTQIYIWNLDEWGSHYSLEWEEGNDTLPEGDILVRSRRIRRRPGQISRKVPLDYSLRSYLEVIFLDPRMKIYVQGSLVKSRPLAKSLNKTAIIKDNIIGKPVQLTLGRSQTEWERANCGIFSYWHGRLIEAYKRVGGMIHNADMGRGVIGVIDVTEIMDDGKDVGVLNDKQGFQDSEVYAKLEDWLGKKTDEYWDSNFDSLQLKKKSALYEPDHEWVQCDKCRKWRILRSGYNSKNLPLEWFCYMQPFSGKCETPEEELDPSVVTVAATRTGYLSKQKHIPCEDGAEGSTKHALAGESEYSRQKQKDVHPPLKRLRRGPLKRDAQCNFGARDRAT